MKIFLDFDDTLFDTKTFGEHLHRVFDACGIPRAAQASTAAMMKDGSVGGWYDPGRHMALLGEVCTFDHAELRAGIEVFLRETKQFLFPEAADFLAQMKARGCTLCILSYGDEDFQMRKIRGTGIEHFFHKIIVTTEDKASALEGELGGDRDIWFIEDRVHYIANVKKAWPRIRTVLMCQKNRRYHDVPDDLCDFVAADFRETVQIFTGVQPL